MNTQEECSDLDKAYKAVVYAYTCELYDAPPHWGLVFKSGDYQLDAEASAQLEAAYSSMPCPLRLIGAPLCSLATPGFVGHGNPLCASLIPFPPVHGLPGRKIVLDVAELTCCT